jgi:hypothetical protein
MGSTIPGWGQCPPPEWPLKGDLPRPSEHVYDAIMDFVQRQPALKDWLAFRTAQYRTAGFAWSAKEHAYAAARDAACWQLRRSPAQVYLVLHGCKVADQSAPILPARPCRGPRQVHSCLQREKGGA